YLEFDYQPPNPANCRVRITNVFRKIDGRWLIVHHHEGLVPTGIPPIAD
ncbi:MAG: nuclear transport factor 2 family protein, partial [Alphaproteobacteria bacterium]|nr:nuclear transport factor 2 family protein [Alphaproteobacteria bacterium]